ncbi:hypothetical protein [Mariniblastus fucicola]|uniref:Secreted protein n=1 Tax=Mariniblastus fucicola TaxID=980251 RepID=A0A5B9PB74_9BACT|nr:hypothetical protein [Mariniblastus fucicola]QEG22759.1 hypothetical protein MFFC18_26420 [Mariniblastus fucicola]
MTRHFPKVILLCLVAVLTPAELTAQVTQEQRERRRAMFGELMKTLIESQMERDPVPTQPGRPNLRPFPGHEHQPTNPLTPNMITARAKMQAWEAESDRFVSLLRKEERRLPRVRPLLADALTTSASIKSLRSNMSRVHSLDPLTDSFCQIDAQWRLLNHQLSQINGLRPECTTSCGRMAAFDSEMCGLFGVEPQFNRRELSRYCTQMASSFQHLIQDVRYDMQGDPQYGAILADCQRLSARLNESGRLIDRGNYDAIVRIYKRSINEWRKLKYKLVSCPHARIQRNVHQIESIGGHIAELLWLPVDIDREYLGMVVQSMERDVNAAFQQVSLQDILACETPGAVLACSREFQNTCGKFSSRLKSNADVDSLHWDYKQFANQWNDVQTHLSQFPSPRLGRSIAQVDAGFQVLQSVFGEGPLIDRGTMVEICSDLDQLSYRMLDLVEQRTARRYDPGFQAAIRDNARLFHQSIHEMHEHVLSNRRHDANAAADVANALASWERLRPLINKCKPEDRRQLQQLRASIEPLMVKLQVVFAG